MATALASLEKIAQGREAEIFAWEPGIILKLSLRCHVRTRLVEGLGYESIGRDGFWNRRTASAWSIIGAG